MDYLKMVLERYDEALKEVMDAQEYATDACHAERREDRSMFIRLAEEELGHAEKISQSGDMLAAMDTQATTVWSHLKEHISDWHSSVRVKISRAENM